MAFQGQKKEDTALPGAPQKYCDYPSTAPNQKGTENFHNIYLKMPALLRFSSSLTLIFALLPSLVCSSHFRQSRKSPILCKAPAHVDIFSAKGRARKFRGLLLPRKGNCKGWRLCSRGSRVCAHWAGMWRKIDPHSD